MRITLLWLILALSACTTNERVMMLNSIADLEILKNQKSEIEHLYGRYKNLLTESEKAIVVQSYTELKRSGNGKLSLDSPVNYRIAKASYEQIVPLYVKYHGQIDPIDRVKILAIHAKLKTISQTIEKGIEGMVKSKQVTEYINTAMKLILAFK